MHHLLEFFLVFGLGADYLSLYHVVFAQIKYALALAVDPSDELVEGQLVLDELNEQTAVDATLEQPLEPVVAEVRDLLLVVLAKHCDHLVKNAFSFNGLGVLQVIYFFSLVVGGAK